MRWVSLLLANLIGSLFLGGLAVAFVIPFNLVALVFWVVVLYHIVRDHLRAERGQDALLAVGTQVATMVLVITVAAFAPVKVTDRLREEPVAVPKTEMTLAELEEFCQFHRRGNLPVYISISFDKAASDQVVRWPAQHMTLGHFIDALESQTSLRHRFSGCGNGWTILWGNDCSFGLSLRDPKTV